jgi:hypothetical protein
VHVITLSQKLEASLSKKHNSITHHKIRETVVSGIIKVAYVNNLLNVVDVLTKPLPKAKRASYCMINNDIVTSYDSMYELAIVGC